MIRQSYCEPWSTKPDLMRDAALSGDVLHPEDFSLLLLTFPALDQTRDLRIVALLEAGIH